MQLSLILQSHLWIFYTLFFNGLLICSVIPRSYPPYSDLRNSFELVFVTSFLLSLLLNFVAASILFYFSLDLSVIRYWLSAITVCLALYLYIKKKTYFSVLPLQLRDFYNYRTPLYIFVFAILFYNGGLVEQIADSWYHLSIANKIGAFNTLNVDHHLNGIASYTYPKLWHCNLAVLHELSGVSLPMLWSAFTAWGGVCKVAAFYLFALSLGQTKTAAVFSALLFVLLPGVGDSYLRVSAWPAHISYTAWFFLLSVTFTFFDRYTSLEREGTISIAKLNRASLNWFIKNCGAHLAFIVLSITIIYFCHLAELVWFIVSLFFYAVALLACDLTASINMKSIEPAWPFLKNLMNLVLMISLIATVVNYMHATGARGAGDAIILAMILFMVLTVFYVSAKESITRFLYTPKSARFFVACLILLLLSTIDYRHLISLVYTGFSYPHPGQTEFAVTISGWLDSKLALPSWKMQLRGGLLYSGLLAIALSPVMLALRRSRLTLFLAANAIFSFVVLVSPYMYTWLTDILNYHSAWRISLLIFTPIILSTAIVFLFNKAIGRGNQCDFS